MGAPGIQGLPGPQGLLGGKGEIVSNLNYIKVVNIVYTFEMMDLIMLRSETRDRVMRGAKFTFISL